MRSAVMNHRTPNDLRHSLASYLEPFDMRRQYRTPCSAFHCEIQSDDLKFDASDDSPICNLKSEI